MTAWRDLLGLRSLKSNEFEVRREIATLRLPEISDELGWMPQAPGKLE